MSKLMVLLRILFVLENEPKKETNVFEMEKVDYY